MGRLQAKIIANLIFYSWLAAMIVPPLLRAAGIVSWPWLYVAAPAAICGAIAGAIAGAAWLAARSTAKRLSHRR